MRVTANTPQLDDKVRYVKGLDGKVRKMYVRKIFDDYVALQESKEIRPNKKVEYYPVNVVYKTEAQAKAGVPSKGSTELIR